MIEHFPEGTVNSMRNTLAERASGDWLCFLDADDELHPAYVSAMRRHFRRRSLLQPMVQRMQRSGRMTRPHFYRPVDLRGANYLVIGTLIEREFFHELGGFREWPHGLEDWDLWARAHYAGATVTKARGAIYIVHVNPDSAHARLAANHDEYVRWYDAVVASHREEAA